MRYVLDSCIALKWVLNESGRDLAERLRDGFLAGTIWLIAPDIFPIEIGNALTKAERQRKIELGQASLFLTDILDPLPELRPSLPLLLRAIELSSRGRLGVYDCLYVALAEAEGCDLLTADERLLRALPDSPIRSLNDFEV
jgi:predicted nucleic acid-binding protein